MVRGFLIAVEGLDRAGKSTQCNLLCEKLRTVGPVELLKFPDRTTTTGVIIDKYLQTGLSLNDQAVHLLFSANRWELEQTITMKLNAGVTLVVDRYVYSGIAFSAAKGLDFAWCKHPDEGLPAADLVVFLEVSPEVAEKRGGYGAERYENREFQEKVLVEFKKLQDENWAWISADQSQEKVAAEIWSRVSDCKVQDQLRLFR